MPLREKVLARLDTLWKSIVVADRIRWVNLHYLGGQIRIDVVLPLSLLSEDYTADELREDFYRQWRRIKSWAGCECF